MSEVIVGVDLHKKSVTIEAIDEQGQKVATGRFSSRPPGLDRRGGPGACRDERRRARRVAGVARQRTG
jgi:hypothetical protein